MLGLPFCLLSPVSRVTKHAKGGDHNTRLGRLIPLRMIHRREHVFSLAREYLDAFLRQGGEYQKLFLPLLNFYLKQNKDIEYNFKHRDLYLLSYQMHC